MDVEEAMAFVGNGRSLTTWRSTLSSLRSGTRCHLRVHRGPACDISLHRVVPGESVRQGPDAALLLVGEEQVAAHAEGRGFEPLKVRGSCEVSFSHRAPNVLSASQILHHGGDTRRELTS